MHKAKVRSDRSGVDHRNDLDSSEVSYARYHFLESDVFRLNHPTTSRLILYYNFFVYQDVSSLTILR